MANNIDQLKQDIIKAFKDNLDQETSSALFERMGAMFYAERDRKIRDAKAADPEVDPDLDSLHESFFADRCFQWANGIYRMQSGSANEEIK